MANPAREHYILRNMKQQRTVRKIENTTDGINRDVPNICFIFSSVQFSFILKTNSQTAVSCTEK